MKNSDEDYCLPVCHRCVRVDGGGGGTKKDTENDSIHYRGIEGKLQASQVEKWPRNR